MANSSPPMRKARSAWRVEVDQQPAHGRQRVVATGMAALVVDPLQVVEVEQQQGERVLAALGVRDQASQLLLEGAVVAEPGQGIEQRGQPRAVVLLAEVIPGGLESLGWREDRASQERPSGAAAPRR